MLNMSRVLSYVKSNMGFPFQYLELEDETISDYIKQFTLRTWSQYFPEKRKMNLDLTDTDLLVDNRANEFYLEEPNNLEILNVVDIYWPASVWYAFGHPTFGTFTHGDLEYFSLNALKAADTKVYSNWDFVFEFEHPNILKIMPNPNNFSECLVEYECMQPEDLSGIANDMQMYFCQLALADIKIIIGQSRKKYGGNLRTPFGEIPVDADLASDGKEEKRDLLEKLQAGSYYNIIMDIT